MRKCVKLLLLAILCSSPVILFGQQDNKTVESQTDPVDTSVSALPTLAELYYSQSMDVNRRYEYDLLNKKIMNYWIGLGVGLAGTFCALYVALLPVTMGFDWSLGAMLGYTLGTLAAIMTPSYYVLFHCLKKASAIDVRTLAQVPVNDRLSMNAVALSYLPNPYSHAFGFGISLKF